jgi:quinol monooxygenase YgiN
MITVIAKLKVKEGKMDEAINALKKAVQRIRDTEPGCIAYVPHTVKGDSTTILFYEKYRDKEALQSHSQNLGQSLSDVLPLLEPGMEINICSEIL